MSSTLTLIKIYGIKLAHRPDGDSEGDGPIGFYPYDTHDTMLERLARVRDVDGHAIPGSTYTSRDAAITAQGLTFEGFKAKGANDQDGDEFGTVIGITETVEARAYGKDRLMPAGDMPVAVAWGNKLRAAIDRGGLIADGEPGWFFLARFI